MTHHRRRHDDERAEESQPGPFMRFFAGLDLKTVLLSLGTIGALGGGGLMKLDADGKGRDQAESNVVVLSALARVHTRIDSVVVGLATEKRHRRALERSEYHGRLPTVEELYGPPAPTPEKKRHKLFGIF